ncbi:M23 family metallopeptidase [Caldinitratiruptor microaerophilus]|uniref:M23ase beta-sheet core domain-containing protein n=1 Tax=Caldinitratiruptor microaerophilus TaxID=671077 RepID=A0AA35G9R6_9FIRM|nr:M23 family metallopeptidase [Caldinitratiruptor microaerophilus]BDG61758.1 hypothetical protein caldi_28480 [Caldinitratiruptor microaerophilus]
MLRRSLHSLRSLGSRLWRAMGRTARAVVRAAARGRGAVARMRAAFTGETLRAAWRRLPADRRSAIGSVALLSLLLAALVAYDRPASVRLSLPGLSGAPGAVAPPDAAALPASPASSSGPRPASSGASPQPATDATARPPAREAVPAAAPGAGRAALPPLPVDRAPLDLPVGGRTVAAFGWALVPDAGEWRLHAGVDLAAAEGDPVRAAAAGTVASTGADPLLGMTVTIDHGDGRTTRYAGLGTVAVRRGDPVRRGQVIGNVGRPGPLEADQGPHLHFEARRDGRPVDPVTVLRAR